MFKKLAQSRTIKCRTNGTPNISLILDIIKIHETYLKKHIFKKNYFVEMVKRRLAPRLFLMLSLLLFIVLGASSDIHHLQLQSSYDDAEDEDHQHKHDSTFDSPLQLQPFKPDYQQQGASMNFQRFLNTISHQLPHDYPRILQQYVDGKLVNQMASGIDTTTRKKKDCNLPVMTRRLFGSVMKRSPQFQHHFAESKQDMEEKADKEDASLLRVKRNEGSDTSCTASRQWIDMGLDYYPRYVKSYHCSSTTCDRGFGFSGECKPKHYKTKVLKRISPSETTSVEDCDHTLPQALRAEWKLIDVKVVTCCDCISLATTVFGMK